MGEASRVNDVDRTIALKMDFFFLTLISLRAVNCGTKGCNWDSPILYVRSLQHLPAKDPMVIAAIIIDYGRFKQVCPCKKKDDMAGRPIRVRGRATFVPDSGA
jgi:hypothetical protein